MKALILLTLFCMLLSEKGLCQNRGGDITSAAERYRRPNDVHQFLKEYSGEWSGTMSLKLSPESQSSAFAISAHNKMILGDRFLQSSQQGYLIGTGFEAITTLGYNTTNQKFTLTIVDNMGTGTLTLVGFWIKPFKTIELLGDIPTPENTDVIHVRQVITFVDKDTYTIQNFDKRGSNNEYINTSYKFIRKQVTQ